MAETQFVYGPPDGERMADVDEKLERLRVQLQEMEWAEAQSHELVMRSRQIGASVGMVEALAKIEKRLLVIERRLLELESFAE